MPADLLNLGKEALEKHEKEEVCEEAKRLLMIPVGVWNAARKMHCAWLTPQACVQKPRFLSKLEELCLEVEARRLIEKKSLRAALEAEYVARLREIYGRLAGMSIDDQLYLLGNSRAYLLSLCQEKIDWKTLAAARDGP